MEVHGRLQEIFREIFDDESIVLTRNTTAVDIEDWDSLAQIDIIIACEAEFGVKYHLNEIAPLKNVGDMIDLTERKLMK